MVETVVNIERTTTTTTSGPPGGANPAVSGDGGFWSGIRLNIDYFRTIPGIIKIVQFVSTISSRIFPKCSIQKEKFWYYNRLFSISLGKQYKHFNFSLYFKDFHFTSNGI